MRSEQIDPRKNQLDPWWRRVDLGGVKPWQVPLGSGLLALALHPPIANRKQQHNEGAQLEAGEAATPPGIL